MCTVGCRDAHQGKKAAGKRRAAAKFDAVLVAILLLPSAGGPWQGRQEAGSCGALL